MRKWLLIAGAGAVVGYVAVYFALDVKPAPEPKPEPPATAVAVPTEPVVLADVVEVTNLDPLLEPRADQSPGVPFDAAAPSETGGGRGGNLREVPPPEPSAPVRAPVPIPSAAD